MPPVFLLSMLVGSSAAFAPRMPARIQRNPRLPVWPAWQGLPLGIMSQLPGPFRGWADQLEDAFGGRVCPMQFDAADADPFILLVHHRHAFRPLDFLRPVFSAVIMPEGFPAHPHRGFETVTYVLPGRVGLTHRDSEGCKMRYGDGAVQWMTASRGMLHEEMWDVDEGSDAELYQLWVNLPPSDKMVAPRVQLLVPEGDRGHAAEVQREGSTPVRRAKIVDRLSKGVRVRTLASTVDNYGNGGETVGASTYSPMTIEHVELSAAGASYSLPLPEGWTCIVYVRRGEVVFDGSTGGGETGDEPSVAKMYETAYLSRRGGDGLLISNAGSRPADVLVLAGEPIGAPVVASGTMVMNTQGDVNQAMSDYQAGQFGIPWDHTVDDDQWVKICEARR